jgi:hypothetical protein
MEITQQCVVALTWTLKDTLGEVLDELQEPVEFLGLRDERGHLQMVLDNNNDISEDWEWLDRGEKSLHDASASLEFGINDVMYAMAH